MVTNSKKQEFSNRLNSILDKANFAEPGKGRQVELAKLFGVSQKGARKWLVGESIPRHEIIQKISNRFGCSKSWLEYGENNNFDQNIENVSEIPQTKLKGIPVISMVQAGDFTEAVDIYAPGFADIWIPPLPKRQARNRRHVYGLIVEGESMSNPSDPKYHFPPGCYLYVDPMQKSPNNGDLIIAKPKSSEYVTFKQFKIEDGSPYLKPLNPEFKRIFEPFSVLGKVIGRYDYQEY